MKDNISQDTLLTHLRVSIVATITTLIIVSGIYPLVVWGLAQALFHNKANGSLILDGKGNVVASRLIGQNFGDAKYFHPRPSANSYDPTNTGGSNYGPMNAVFLYGSTNPASTQPVAPATQPTPESVAVDGVQLRIVHYAKENHIHLSPWEMDPKTGLVALDRKTGKAIVRTEKLTDFMDKPKDPDNAALDDVRLIHLFNDANHPLRFKPDFPIPADAVTASGSGLDPHISLDNAKLQMDRVAGARHIPNEAVQKLIAPNTDGPDLGILGEPGVNVVTLNLALDKLSP